MYGNIKTHLQNEIKDIKESGLYKEERIIVSPQGAEITLDSGETVLNFCANNYLGLSSHPEVIQAAKDTLDLTDLVCRQCGLYVEPRISIRN